MSEHPGFGDSDAQRIIARAAELDAQGAQRLDAKALREIAAEAGISRAAMDQAILERLQPPSTERPWVVRHRGRLIVIGIVAAVLISRLFP